MLHDQLGGHGAGLDAGSIKPGRKSAVDEKVRLVGIAQHVEARILGRHGRAREIDVCRDVLEADQHQRIVVHLMLVMADQGPHMALLVVVLALAEAVIDEEGGTANQTPAQGVDKCLALAVDFGQEIMRAADIHRRAQFGGTVLPGKGRFIAVTAKHHAALMPLAPGALQQLHRHRIQHLVADDHAFHGLGQCIHPAHQMLVPGQRQFLARAQRAR
ncbi:hypothetical protein SDC9_114884 [bioreactor metagenome]|uniref:Uncharacterized protein n=1 Tax=bioreactor metagenome TaxID=1076179 RepID=A0A645BRB3_9ZZZZ